MSLKDSILIVDDDVAVVNLLTDRLKDAGYKVTSANDAMQALIQAQGVKPRLVILDIQMPAWGTGVEAYNKLRATAALKDVPVIFLTGIDPKQAKGMMPADPKIRLLCKPIDWIMLEQAINELTGDNRPLG